MSIFKTNRGLEWHYKVEGGGESILFIHGFGGSGTWWQHQVDFLKTDYQTILLDLPGHGKSQWQTVSLTDLAMDIRQIVNHLGIHHLTVVAASLGGLIAFELYRLMPSSIMRMSFVGSMPKFARSDSYPAGLDIDKIRKMSSQFDLKDSEYGMVLDMFFRSLFTMKERDSQQWASIKELRKKEILPNREALKAFLDILEKTDLRDRIASIICPLQFIAGREDYICTPDIMQWMSEHTYNARFDIMEGCGHLPFLTEVKEYNRLLEDFLIN